MSNAVNVDSLTFKQLDKVREDLRKMIKVGGSDLHVKANAVTRVRINGEIKMFKGEVLSKEDALTFAKEILKSRFAEFVEKKELDFVYPFNESHRFRVNMFFQIDGVSAVFRVIKIDIPKLSTLNLPEVVNSFVQQERGIVLVTGVTGSGKSTTLAAIINEINLTKNKHIITIEEPVEFVHKSKGCIINQRSVGQDTRSFKSALKAALREDPDIILVGEIRDKETVDLALHAADTGHLVFSTMHTTDAKETINRIISEFPVDEQDRVRASLATTLKGVISQRLVQCIDGGRRAALEVLVRTPTIEKLIRENRDYEIIDAIEHGKKRIGSQSFDQALIDLYNNGDISKEEALRSATSASDLELKMSGLVSGGISEREESEDGNSVDINDVEEDTFDLK